MSTLRTATKQRGRPFQPGQSGNPGGRPKVAAEIRDLARHHTATALRTLVEIAEHGESENARVAAANALLDRGWGKPRQEVEIGGTLNLEDLTDDELLRIARSGGAAASS
jgi:hypothetical protein